MIPLALSKAVSILLYVSLYVYKVGSGADKLYVIFYVWFGWEVVNSAKQVNRAHWVM